MAASRDPSRNWAGMDAGLRLRDVRWPVSLSLVEKNYIVVGTLIHVLLMATSKLALGVLLRGLQKLKKDVKERSERLQEELKAKQKISKEDEAWLDGAGNLVDEERVIELLKDAADYQKGLEQLSNGDREVVERLRALGDSGAETLGVASKKRKRMAFNSIISIHI